VVGSIASTASTSSIVAIASVASVAVVVASATLLPPTSNQILEKSSKLWRGCSQTETGKEKDDCELHIVLGVGGSQSAPVTLPY